MKHSKYTIPAFCISLFAFSTVNAQNNTDTLPQLDEVSIVKAYEPILILSNKVPFAPNLPNIVKTKPDAQTYLYSDVKAKLITSRKKLNRLNQPEKSRRKISSFMQKSDLAIPSPLC
ncbi:MAG: hypothetical protein IPM95_02990 [Sphingobacteriales bacterium]|nr:hypothetical protein [Sphingobacteriales bacterium]